MTECMSMWILGLAFVISIIPLDIFFEEISIIIISNFNRPEKEISLLYVHGKKTKMLKSLYLSEIIFFF